MRLQITNRTHWNTAHLREFIKRGVRLERPSLCKRGAPALRVTIKYNRGGERYKSVSGCASYTANWMRIMVPSGAVDRTDLAHTIVHELGHTAGIHHDAMQGCPVYSRVGNWRELYAWAETLPLDKVTAAKPSLETKLSHAEKMLRAARTREKRATTIRQKWERKIRRLQKLQSAPDAMPLAAQGL